MTGQVSGQIVLQCPQCGARASLQSGKTHCHQLDHPPMIPTWIQTDIPLTPEERKQQNV